MDSFRISDRALAEIDRIRQRLERDAGPNIARYVQDEIFEAFHDLVRLPQIGHQRDELGRPGLLYHNVFRYVIVFRREPRVVILRVIHGARDLPRHLQ